MRSARPLYVSVFSLLITLFSANLAHASDEYADEYDVKARVIRISLVTGAVNLKRSGNTDWERARLNFPLVEGDTVSTDRESKVEIQIDARNFVRLGPNSILRIATLRDEGVALSLVEGTASIRLARFDRDHEYFEVDAPKSTLAAEKKGLYRIDVAPEGRVRLTVREGGQARIYSDTSGFTLRDGRTAQLVFEGTDAGDWELIAADSRDSWDNWVNDRERYLGQRQRYDVQYYDNYVWGAEDLDAYGDWTYANDYGWVWRPHATVINNYYNWAPYRYGSWTWCSPYGWTWVGYEPWGWAPYHYGRWVYYNNYWAWCPRSYYHRHRSWWRPALVAFVSVHLSFGDNICWYPLSYYHRDPHSRYYRAVDRLTPLRSDELANLRRVNPLYVRAVTTLAARDFGSDRARLQPASEALARRVVSQEPLRDVPVRPAYAPGNNATNGDRADRITGARPARVVPGVVLPDRPTGAAARTPGVPLDDELRRSRLLNGRDPRPAEPPDSSSNAIETGPTGAVARPARPPREPGDRNEILDPNERRARPSPPSQPAIRPSRDANESGEPRERMPARPSSRETASPADRPARPRNENPPERIERPSESKRPERVERPERPSGVEPPPPRPEPERRYESPARPEPPPRNDPRPRYEPPARNDPPPRYEPPARNDPPPRNEPPPRNDPPPRNEPPPRNDPPAQRSEPRSEPARPPKDPDVPSRGERKNNP